MTRMRPLLRIAASLTAVLMAAGPGVAGTEDMPEVTDIGGDANFANSNGVGGTHVGIGTSPASIDSADLRAIWLETAYTKSIEVIEDVRWVRYTPTGLVVRFKTTAPATPTFGPSVIFRFPATIGGSCQVFVEVWLRGSAPGAVDRQYAAYNQLGACPASGAVTAGVSLGLSGNVATATIPFEVTSGAIQPGATVGTYTRPHVRIVQGAGTTYCCTAPVIDEMPLGTEFVVGSDVPADVNCSQEPSHPDCEDGAVPTTG